MSPSHFERRAPFTLPRTANPTTSEPNSSAEYTCQNRLVWQARGRERVSDGLSDYRIL
jgi:hypothetical protein